MTERTRPSRFAANPNQRQPTGSKPGRSFPTEREIQRLESDLHAFNGRIRELEDAAHTGHALAVLKANAIDIARKIDELRALLAEPAKKT